MKKSFTLIELMIVILLISLVYALSISSFKMEKKKEFNLDIYNIKDFLIKNFEYTKNLSFVCTKEQNLPCYVFIDEKLVENLKIENFFSQEVRVYNYDKLLSDYEFKTVSINNSEYQPFFELTFNKDFKHKNMIVETSNSKIFLLSSLSNEVKVFNSTNEILDRFNDLEIEVKDAF
ncbi:pilus assembly FimT family protein [Halarcobacter bivalviorum]|uniref:Prepilin-type N-terminal cleavage/methylation domain-containing protein n=1 Tax=Halarcobacter bivalviorum TaxID=663364 RepID=A0AAX2ACW7_9BACT|nr:type II secretion system protein [Halarcobacter bivalviorum]AXH12185.1 hypothetical protein ABIV_1183 [Halarcobacter bivalviorum]RXK11290.1 hypothetical protein CRV05_02680 [Halarcobacter bivalviorum]